MRPHRSLWSPLEGRRRDLLTRRRSYPRPLSGTSGPGPGLSPRKTGLQRL